MQHRHDVGEVVLALAVLGAQPAERRREQIAAEAVDRGVDLVDLELLGRGVTLLDDASDVAVAIATDASVARGIGEARREQRGRGTALTVLSDERGDGLAPQQRRVAGEHQEVARLVEVVVDEARHADEHRVARAALHDLLDEPDAKGRRTELLHLLRDGLGAVTDHHDGAIDVASAQGAQHVQQHRPTAQEMEGLRSRGPHACALTGCEHHGRQRHGVVLPTRR